VIDDTYIGTNIREEAKAGINIEIRFDSCSHPRQPVPFLVEPMATLRVLA
jgi:hypothetical protein